MVGPFGKALPRGVEYADKYLVDEDSRLAACKKIGRSQSQMGKRI